MASSGGKQLSLLDVAERVQVITQEDIRWLASYQWHMHREEALHWKRLMEQLVTAVEGGDRDAAGQLQQVVAALAALQAADGAV